MPEQSPGLPWIKWFPRDFASATRGWPLVARGAYRELLDAQWDMGGALPDDPEQLRDIARATPEEWQTAWRFVAPKFPQSNGGRLNPKLEEHRNAALQERESKSRGARQTNARRWGTPSLSESHSDSLSDRSATRRRVATSTSTSTSTSTKDSGVLEDSDSRPPSRTVRPKPAYEGKEFHDQVIAAYHELLPALPAVKIWSKKRAQALNARIQERCRDGKGASTIEYWRKLFGEVATSDLLCGRSTGFRADLEWLLRPENFAKVIEGRYAPRAGANGSAAHVR